MLTVGGGFDMSEQQLSEDEYLEILIKADDNRQWIHKHYTTLSAKYPNQYICVKEKKIICSGKSKVKIDHTHNELDVVCEYILPHGTAMLL
ncbi:MAG: hypothetical protein Q7J68_07715 [Thermoplasmata archaeon]|nr:hypothetical protein [Thermoplasmata archaeon]